MANPQLSRAVFGVPAWVWLSHPVPLAALVTVLGVFYPPSKIPEPSERAEILAEPVLVAPSENGFRFLTLQESKGVAPVWAVGLAVYETAQRDWGIKNLTPALMHRSSRWTYALTSNRFDDGWQRDGKNPFSLSDETLRSLRPAIVRELNRRDPTRKGDRLESLLNHGLQESSYWCPQNVVVILAWFSIAMALVSFVMMRVAHPPSTSAAYDR